MARVSVKSEEEALFTSKRKGRKKSFVNKNFKLKSEKWKKEQKENICSGKSQVNTKKCKDACFNCGKQGHFARNC